MQRIVRALSLVTADGEEHMQGASVEMTDADVERFEKSGSLVPTAFNTFAEFEEHQQASYRAGRGDVLAAGRLSEARAGSIVDVSTPATEHAHAVTTQLAWLRENEPTIEQVLERVTSEPELARAMLEAEHVASGGSPRKGVVEGLTAIAPSLSAD